MAESFARIFFRNAINLGLPAITCPGIAHKVNEGDLIKINISTGEIENITSHENLQGEGLSEFVLSILKKGGIKPLFKEKYARE